MDDIRDIIKKGFAKCKLDIETLKDENSQLKNHFNKINDENSQLKTKIDNLNNNMSELKGELNGLKIAIDYIKNFQSNINNNDNNKISNTQNDIQQEKNNSTNNSNNNTNTTETTQINSTNKTKKNSINHIKDPYEALLAFKAKANKREILKQKLITMISENGMYLSELKFLFVDHYRYCSKATFYNYLKELELEQNIKIERMSGKNIVYPVNLLNKQI
jgi:chromosome segregation ATPase